MKKPSKKTFVRLIWLGLAGLFLLTIALTAVIGYQSTHQNNAANNTTQEGANLNCKSDPSIKVNQPSNGQFSDTKLASFTPPLKIDQLSCIDIVKGSGAQVSASSVVTVNYVGALASDGTIFDSSYKTGQPATFPLSGVIKGWTLGMPGMKAGGVRRLLIPAAQAYGASSPSVVIPPNSDMVFDISLISVN